MVAVHRGNLCVTLYSVSGSNANVKETRELADEAKSGFNYKKGDKVTEMRFTQDSKLRLTVKQNAQHYFIDVDLQSRSSDVRQCKRFEDVSVFADSEDLSVLNKEQIKLEELLQEELDDSNNIVGMVPSLVKFPSADKRFVLFYIRVNEEDKYYRLYDLEQGMFCRKFSHMHQDDEAFCISHDAKWIAKIEDDEL